MQRWTLWLSLQRCKSFKFHYKTSNPWKPKADQYHTSSSYRRRGFPGTAVNHKMAHVSPLIDSMIKEYLLFRGFTSTLKAFENEIKTDKDKSFRVVIFVSLNYIFKALRFDIYEYPGLFVRQLWKNKMVLLSPGKIISTIYIQHFTIHN